MRDEFNVSQEELDALFGTFTVDGETPKSVNDYLFLVQRKARREFFTKLKALTGGNKCKAARALYISPANLDSRLETFGLKWRELTVTETKQ